MTDDERVRHALRALADEAEPRTDLWKRIERTRRRRIPRWIPLAGAAVVVALFGAGVIAWARDDSSGTRGRVVAGPAAIPSSAPPSSRAHETAPACTAAAILPALQAELSHDPHLQIIDVRIHECLNQTARVSAVPNGTNFQEEQVFLAWRDGGWHVIANGSGIRCAYDDASMLGPDLVAACLALGLRDVEHRVALGDERKALDLVSHASPILVPTAIPSGWTADVRADPEWYSIQYRSPDSAKRFTIQITIPNPPTPTGTTTQRTLRFHDDASALYQVDDATVSTSSRQLVWREAGQWSSADEPSWTGGPPYYATSDGLTDAEFWQIVDSLR